MNKKVKLLSIVGLLVVLFTTGCATSKPINQEKSAENSNFIIRGLEQDPGKLTKDQFLSVTKKIENPEYLISTNWSKVRIFSDFLDSFQGHKDFSNDKKYEFLSYIFDELPMNAEEGIVRQIYIGNYFENSDPLEIRIGIFIPKGDASEKNEKVIILMSNIIVLNDGSINKVMGNIINLDVNASIYCGLNNKLLTNGEKSKSDITIPFEEIETKSSLEKIMIAQSYLADEDISNDILAEKLVSKILDENKDIPAIRIMAMLKKYEYYLSLENISEAQSLWEEILVYSMNVPGDMNPETLEILNGESIFLMKSLFSRANN